MSNPLHDIDKLFRDGIEDRSDYPPKNLWDNIEAELDKKIALAYKRKYRALKRNTSILLALLLGLVLYQAVKLYQHTQTSQENKAVLTDQPGQLASTHPAATSYQTNDPDKNIQPGNANLVNDKNLSAELQQSTNDLGPIDKFKTIDRKVDPDRTIIDGEGGLNIQLSQRLTGENTEIAFTKSNGDGGEIKDRQSDGHSLLSNLASFSSIANDDSWMKDIAARFKPSISGSVLRNFTTAKKLNDAVAGKARFSLLVYASPNIGWTTLDDDTYQGTVRRRANRGRGGNGGGTNGGNNGSGNTQGGTNGANSGGGNSGGGTNGGSSGNNSGGRGGRGDDRKDIEQSETANIAYSAGIKLGYNLGKGISLQTGLNYLVNSTSIKPKLIFAGKDHEGNVGYRINCSSGYSFVKPNGASNPAVGDSTLVSDTRNTVSYIGVPVIVEYNIFSTGRFSLKASTGAQVNMLLKGQTRTVFAKGTTNESAVSSPTQGLKTAYFSAIASVTAEMRIKKDLSLTLAPAGQFGLSYMNKGTSVKTRPNYIGLAAGLKLRF